MWIWLSYNSQIVSDVPLPWGCRREIWGLNDKHRKVQSSGIVDLVIMLWDLLCEMDTKRGVPPMYHALRNIQYPMVWHWLLRVNEKNHIIWCSERVNEKKQHHIMRWESMTVAVELSWCLVSAVQASCVFDVHMEEFVVGSLSFHVEEMFVQRAAGLSRDCFVISLFFFVISWAVLSSWQNMGKCVKSFLTYTPSHVRPQHLCIHNLIQLPLFLPIRPLDRGWALLLCNMPRLPVWNLFQARRYRSFSLSGLPLDRGWALLLCNIPRLPVWNLFQARRYHYCVLVEKAALWESLLLADCPQAVGLIP